MDNEHPLKVWRIAAGLTQDEVAEALGVSRQAVAKWEKGGTGMPIGVSADLRRLSRGKLTGDDIAEWEGENL